MDADLHKVIYSKNKIEDVHIQYFTYQILKALKYMHSAQVMHRDLKPSNILVNANCELKICDFGLSRGFNRSSGSATNDELTEYVVTRWYRAPEVMTSCSEYNEKIDVWSVGCILAELHGRKPLFPGEDYIRQMNLIFGLLGTPSSHDLKFISNVNALEYIKSLPRKPKIPFAKIYYEHEMNPLAADMLEKMIVFNPLNRMSVEECLKHPYIAGLHNEDNEPVCSAPFDFSFENEKMDKATLQKHMWEEIYHFRPKLKELHEEKGITHQDLTPNKHFNNTPSSTKPKPILQSPASSARKYADISDSMKKLKMRQ